MNKTKLKKLKAHYENMRKDLVDALKIASKNPELDLAGDEIDQVQGNALHQMSEKLSSRGTDNLVLIDNALRILAEEGSAIDECEECSETIGEKRLMALLGVRICISCAEDAENTSKMFA